MYFLSSLSPCSSLRSSLLYMKLLPSPRFCFRFSVSCSLFCSLHEIRAVLSRLSSSLFSFSPLISIYFSLVHEVLAPFHSVSSLLHFTLLLFTWNYLLVFSRFFSLLFLPVHLIILIFYTWGSRSVALCLFSSRPHRSALYMKSLPHLFMLFLSLLSLSSASSFYSSLLHMESSPCLPPYAIKRKKIYWTPDERESPLIIIRLGRPGTRQLN